MVCGEAVVIPPIRRLRKFDVKTDEGTLKIWKMETEKLMNYSPMRPLSLSLSTPEW